MKKTSVVVNKIELEMIAIILQGTRPDLQWSHHEGKQLVTIELSAFEVNYVFENVEWLIESYETDQGDWARASGYRSAKNSLISKLRPFVFGIVPQD